MRVARELAGLQMDGRRALFLMMSAEAADEDVPGARFSWRSRSCPCSGMSR